MTRLLVLRPQPGADATAARALAAGFQPVIAPMFAVRAVPWDMPDPAAYDAILMTSANAARHGSAALARYRHLTLFAVGAATARAASAAGFNRIVTGDGDGAAMLAGARAAGHSHILHLAGREHVALDGVDRRIVYASEPLETAIPDAEIALLHSVRAARRFAEIARDRIAIAAFSPQVAAAAGSGWRAVAVADRPDDESLLAAAARLCDQGALAGNEDQA